MPLTVIAEKDKETKNKIRFTFETDTVSGSIYVSKDKVGKRKKLKLRIGFPKDE